MEQKRQMSETLLVGSLLAVAGGYLDAYTYLTRGGVFANAQTGNMVLMGIFAAKGEWYAVIKYLIPILAFICGIITVEVIRINFEKNEVLHWRQIVVGIEIAVLIGVALLPGKAYDVTVNVLVSFVCSMQVQAFRKMNGNAYATTMCTGNLRSATEAICNYKITKDAQALRTSIQYIGIILFFILGAVVGCVFCRIFAEKAVFGAAALLLAVMAVMFQKIDSK